MSARNLDGVAEHIDHLQRRVVQDALAEATAAYWRRRAEAFEAVKHDPKVDYDGRADLDQLRASWERADETARACRAAAEFWEQHGVALPEDEGLQPVGCAVCMTFTSPWTCSCGATRIGGAA